MHCLLPASLTLLPLLFSSVLAQASGKFSTLTFNVAGLPKVLNGNDVPGDKTDNTARIGKLLSQYDKAIIHVQEDFNYHATLYANDNHPHRTSTSGGVPLGSGLNTLSSFPFTDFRRIKWDKCSSTEGADCLTPKGFTFMRVQLAAGVSVDVYNLHADAGDKSKDLTARAANLRQVSNYIKTESAGNAVLVFGDSNSRYTRAPDDIPGIFSQDNGLTDVWVELIRKGSAPAAGSKALVCENPSKTSACETVDKTWYRGSDTVTLKATSFAYASEKFLSTDGKILSDHNPVLCEFTWSTRKS